METRFFLKYFVRGHRFICESFYSNNKLLSRKEKIPYASFSRDICLTPNLFGARRHVKYCMVVINLWTVNHYTTGFHITTVNYVVSSIACFLFFFLVVS